MGESKHVLVPLHHNEIGSVAFCEECNEINMTIKDACFYLSISSYHRLSNDIFNVDMNAIDMDEYMFIKIPRQPLYFRLMPDEFLELAELVNLAKLNIQIRGLLVD